MSPRALLLALACVSFIDASAAQAQASPAAPASVERPARIRLFGQNGVGLTMFTNAHCQDAYEEEIEGSGAVSLGFKALVGKRQPNTSIGIPQSDTTRTLEDRNRLMANPYYTEFVLVPGQPVALQAQIASGAGLSCGRGRGVQVSFVAEAGVDYEGDMIRDFNAMQCGIAVRRVAADGSLSPVQTAQWPKKCDAPPRPAPSLMTLFLDADQLQYRLAEEGAEVDSIDNDKGGIEDLEEMLQEAPLAAGVGLCIVADEALDASALGAKLPGLLEARGVADRVVRFRPRVLEAEWGLTAQHPLSFALAEYYCRAASGRR